MMGERMVCTQLVHLMVHNAPLKSMASFDCSVTAIIF
jgi:hypothetical protein